MARIFVSSTFGDLQECRAAVRLALRRLRQDDIAMEYYVADSERPVDRCLQDVRESDLYVGVFAWRYGYVPAGHDRSITELEYRAAVDAGKDRLVFLLRDEAPWPRASMDTGEGGVRIEALRAELAREHLCSFFSGPDDLGSAVTAAVSNWLQAHGQDAAGDGVIPAATLAVYRQRLEQQYGRLDLDALTPPQREEYLQISLRAVFLEPGVREDPPPVELPKEIWAKLQATGELAAGDLPSGIDPSDLIRARDQYRAKPLRPALSVVADAAGQHVVLLGDPGSGKSTLARYLTLALAAGDGGGEDALQRLDGYLPLLVELRSFVRLQDHATFLEFVDHLARTEKLGLEREPLDRYLRHDGRTLVIFDGLDEVFDPRRRDAVARQIAGFAAEYPKVRVIVTSRTIGYRRATLTNAKFAHYTLQDLDEEQVEEFLRRWYSLALHDQAQAGEQRRERLVRAIRESRSIRELAGNPLLLTVLAIIGKHQELPRERWAVYDHAAEILVEHWDVNRHLRDARVDAAFIGKDDKKALLRRVAHRMQAGVAGLAGNSLRVEDLAAEFESYLVDRYQRDPASAKTIAAAMIDQLRERNFILSRYGAEVYGFVHRAFLEFFCASHFVWQFEKDQVLSIEQLEEVFRRHRGDETWGEVLRLITGIVADRFAGQLVAAVVAGDAAGAFDEGRGRWLLLAVQCLSEVRNLPAASGQAGVVLRALVTLLEDSVVNADPFDTWWEEDLIPAVAAIGPAWPGREAYWGWFERRGRYLAWRPISQAACRIAAVLLPDIDAIRQALTDLALRAPDSRQREGGMAGLATGWRDHPQTLPLLRGRAVDDRDEDVRQTALEAVAEGWPTDPHTLTLLRERATNDPHPSTRRNAVEALAQRWPSHPDLLPLLRDRAVRDRDEGVRWAALEAAAEGWPTDPDTLTLLRERATNDPHPSTRRNAIEALAERWPSHPDLLALLRDRAENDPHHDPREAAVEAVAEGWPADPETLPLLRNLAAGTGHHAPRVAATEAIAQGWPADPGTLPWLRDRAVHDPHHRPRCAALEAIAHGWPTAAGTLPLLRDRAANDWHPAVRQDALEAIAQGWPTDPDTLPLLRERAARDPQHAPRQAAAEAMAEIAPTDPGTLLLLHELAVNDRNAEVRQTALRAIATGRRDDPDTLPLLRDRASHDAHPDVRQAVLEGIAEGWAADSGTPAWLLGRASADPDADVRETALRVALNGWAGDPGTLPWLHDQASGAAQADLRQATVEAIGRAWPAHPQTLPLLADQAVTDGNNGVRQAAVEAVARRWPADPQTLALLRDRAVNDRDGSVRKAAIEALARGEWPTNPGTLRLLHDLAHDRDENVRQAAAIAIGDVWPDHPDTFPLLRDLATNDAFIWVRSAAAQGLADGWPDHPDTLPLLRELATHDRDAFVRLGAAEAIAEGWPDHPDTLPLLRDLAANDRAYISNPAATEAIRMIGEGWPDHPETLPLLRYLAAHDRDEYVRRAAAQALAEGFPERPDTLPLLLHLAANDRSGHVRRAALEALAGWPCDPRVLHCLHDRALSDPDDDVRAAALMAIADGWQDPFRPLAGEHQTAVRDEPRRSGRR